MRKPPEHSLVDEKITVDLRFFEINFYGPIDNQTTQFLTKNANDVKRGEITAEKVKED
jgi:hypothetical protein